MANERHATPRFGRTLFETGFAGHEFDQAMLERNAEAQRRLEGPPPESGPGWVQIVNGANEDVLPIGGQPVGVVRREFGGLFNIDPDAIALLSGEPVAEGHTLRHGETLEFIKPIGRKGMGRVWTREEFCEVFKIGVADLDAMIAKGLPVHRMKDGSMRITETQVDAFLDRLARPESNTQDNGASSSEAIVLSLVAEIRRIADALDSAPPGVVTALKERSVVLPPALARAVPTLPEGVGPLPAPHTISQVGAGDGGRSPYLDGRQAAAYLGITLGSLYGVVERRHLTPLRGPRRRYRFTTEMLDDYLGRKGGGR